MDKDRVLSEMNVIFKEVFNEPQLTVSRDTSANDVANWDSMTNLFLIDAIEQRFKMKYTLDEIMNARHVGDLCDIIVQRGHLE